MTTVRVIEEAGRFVVVASHPEWEADRRYVCGTKERAEEVESLILQGRPVYGF